MNVKTLASEIEDKLIDRYNYENESSYATLTHGNYYLDAELSRGNISITVGGNSSNCELPNIEKAIADAIDVDRIDNEVNLLYLEKDEETYYDCGYKVVGY